MAKNPFRQMKAANRAQARILRRDTRSDFKVTSQGLDAIMGNLLTSQQGLGRKLSRVNQRSLDAMRRISARSDNRMDRILNVGENIVDRRYGSAIAADPNRFKGVARLGKSQAKVNKGQLRAGELQMRGANEAMDILEGAAQTAADAGQYELAQALRERQSADAETIAASRLALQQQRLDAALNERYLRLQTRLASGGTGGEGFQNAAATLMSLSQEGATAEQLAGNIDALAIQYNLGPSQKAKLQEMASSLQAGDDASAGSEAARAFTEQMGMSPSAALPQDREQAVNKAVWKAFDPDKDVPGVGEALSILGLEKNEEGKYVDDEGVEYAEEVVLAGVAYVQSTWQRIAARAGA